jgi:hypothetical protein
MVRWSLVGLGVLLAASGVNAGGDTKGALPRWEYRVLSKDQLLQQGKQDLAAGLNSLGKQGWELVGIDGGYIFKRREAPVPSIPDLKRRVADAEKAVDSRRERLALTELMVRKGLASEVNLQATQRLLRQAQAALDQAQRDLDAQLLPPPKPAPEPVPKK